MKEQEIKGKNYSSIMTDEVIDFIVAYSEWKHELLLRGNLNFLKTDEDDKWFLNTEPTKKPGQQNWIKLSEKALVNYFVYTTNGKEKTISGN